MRYERKPLEVEAFQWKEQPLEELPDWVKKYDVLQKRKSFLIIGTTESDIYVRLDEYCVLIQNRLEVFQKGYFESIFQPIKES